MNWNLPRKLVLVPVLILLMTLGWGRGTVATTGVPPGTHTGRLGLYW